MTTAPLHVIAGAGQTGPLIADRLLSRGYRVRLVRRGAFTPPAGAEAVRADVTDPAAAAEAFRGASVVYHTANPRYHRWPQELVPLARGIVSGAAAAGARVVALDNLYMYPGGVMSEDTPVAPVSRKGRLRAEAAAVMLASDAPVAIARAADFIGPGSTLSIFGDRFWQKALRGRAVEYMGDLDQPHTYSYIPDVVDALVALGTTEREDAFRRVWHLPALPAEPTRVWMERLASAAGVELRTRRLRPWMLRLAGLFIPEAAELPEMMYQWERPFVLDDGAFRRAFRMAPTPAATVVAETIAWARAHYAPAHALATA